MARLKPKEWWALKYPWKDNIGFLPHFMASTKRELIKEFEESYGEPWSGYRKKGWKFVRVIITEVSE